MSFFCTSVVWHFIFFSNLFTSKLPLITFQVFKHCVFFWLQQSQIEQAVISIYLKRMFWGANFMSHPYLLPPQKRPERKISWQMFYQGEGCILFKVTVVPGLVSAHKALQNARLQVAVTAVVFKARDGPEKPREGCARTRSAAVWITYRVCLHTRALCFAERWWGNAALQERQRVQSDFVDIPVWK